MSDSRAQSPAPAGRGPRARPPAAASTLPFFGDSSPPLLAATAAASSAPCRSEAEEVAAARKSADTDPLLPRGTPTPRDGAAAGGVELSASSSA